MDEVRDSGRGELVECVQIEGRVTVRTQGLEDLVFQQEQHGLGVGGECQQSRKPEMQGQIMQRL